MPGEDLGGFVPKVGDAVLRVGYLAPLGAMGGYEAVDSSRKKLYFTIRRNISRTCHSLKVLAGMGHPYSKKNPNNPHPEKPYIVHKQEGTLLSSLKTGFKVTSTNFVGWVTIDESIVKPPAVRSVLFGSKRMIGRDFMTGSLNEVSPQMPKVALEGVKKGVKWAWVSDLYLMARVFKTISKFYGTAEWASKTFRVARTARTVQVLCNGDYPGLSKRFYNQVIGGKIASQFMFRGGDIRYADQLVNTQITKHFTSQYILQGPAKKIPGFGPLELQ